MVEKPPNVRPQKLGLLSSPGMSWPAPQWPKRKPQLTQTARGFTISWLRTKSLCLAGQGSLTPSCDSKGLLTASWGIGRSWEESWEELGRVGRSWEESSSLLGVLGEIYKAGVGSEFFLNFYLRVLGTGRQASLVVKYRNKKAFCWL